MPAPASQTLSRGIRILEILADGPLSIDEVATRLDVHRSIAYRLLRTLEDHRLVARNAAGLAALGPRMA
ncbi:MAG: helix-turn-helix domain-containing protein, partial [Microbacterium sp.]